MKPILLCLHGWGGSKESFTELRQALRGTDLQILTPDLPGFGDEPEPDHPWTIEDYSKWVISWLEERGKMKDESEWFLLGHSHGGRIAIKLVAEQLQATSYKLPTRMFLCAPAGIKSRKHFKRALGLTLAKIGNAILSLPGLKQLRTPARKLMYKILRVHDYEKASPVMQQTMINVTQEDLEPLLKKIDVPTDLFWGTADTMTPYSDALIMEKEIPNATLHTFKKIRHRVHRDKAKEIAEVITKYI